jgi:signal transduction histidine kinase
MKLYIEKQILRQSLIGFLLMLVISIVVTFFLARYKMATELQDLAAATANSYRSRILEGDIMAAEKQIHEFLQLKVDEKFAILDQHLQRIYHPKIGSEKDGSNLHASDDISKTPNYQFCGNIGLTCFDSYMGPASILVPIYFDAEKKNLFGYIYLSRNIQLDWVFVIIVFLIFGIGYLTQLFALGKIAKNSLNHLGSEIERWSFRLKKNPKDTAPLSKAPYSELIPLKEAIEGLNSQIFKFENEASQKAKLLVLRGIAHDILEPVYQLQMGLASLEHLLPKETQIYDIFNGIEKSIKRVSTVATQVKSLNQENQNNKWTDLNHAVSDFLQSARLSPEIVQKKIDIKFMSQVSGAFYTPLSALDIQRILQNLIQNAVQASPVSSEIQIDVKNENNFAILSIADQGCGIPEYLKEKVFEPEFTTKYGVGTGLGLSIVRHICEQRDSSVELKSEINKGTQITIKIPLVESKNIGGEYVL